MKNGGKNKSVAFIILFSVYIYILRVVHLKLFICLFVCLFVRSFIPSFIPSFLLF